MSLPWMRSYIMPTPPRTTVLPLPVRSYAKPTRGPKAAQWLLTKPLGTPFFPGMPIPLRYNGTPARMEFGLVPKPGLAPVQPLPALAQMVPELLNVAAIAGLYRLG